MSELNYTPPRPLSRVTFDFDRREFHDHYPFKRNALYIFLGELVNMPGHCVVVEQNTGKIYAGYHTDHFVEFSDGE